MSAANTQVFKCCWNACRCQQSLRQGIIPASSLGKVSKAVQGHRSPLTFLCCAEGALVLPPFAFPSPQSILCLCRALLPHSEQVQMCDLRSPERAQQRRGSNSSEWRRSPALCPASQGAQDLHLHDKPLELAKSILLGM